MSMKKMKQMPYKVEEGAIEQAKYRAKMAVREVAHPIEHHSHKVQWRWATVASVAVVAVVAVIGFVARHDNNMRELTPMESLVAQMNNVPDDILNEFAVDAGYYLEEENQL